MTTELLTVEQMYEADRRTIAQGTSGVVLMERAGQACAEHIVRRWEPGRVSILCGPGNNGGDGFVIARHLQSAGWDVEVLVIALDTFSGDSKTMFQKWAGPVSDISELNLDDTDLIVDAVFGAGLSRAIDGDLHMLFDRINASDVPVASVDLPSGVSGDTGQILGGCLLADATITFARKKLGHVLFPGRTFCGDIEVADIGISDKVVAGLNPGANENLPPAWLDLFPSSNPGDHKYTKGHVLAISGGPMTTGAIRLAARGALRAGAGLVTVATPAAAALVHASHLTTIMVQSFKSVSELRAILADRRKNTCIYGPGAGVGDDTREVVKVLTQLERPLVLDADALTAFADHPEEMFNSLHDKVVLTPHEGEFERLFGSLDKTQKVARARDAAAKSGAIVVLKGPDTVIAHPGGRVLVNTNAPAYLATAGAGDVLAGFIGGLLAQGMPAFEAAGAGVWLHGAAGAHRGRGLIAEDLPEVLPEILQVLEEPK